MSLTTLRTRFACGYCRFHQNRLVPARVDTIESDARNANESARAAVRTESATASESGDATREAAVVVVAGILLAAFFAVVSAAVESVTPESLAAA